MKIKASKTLARHTVIWLTATVLSMSLFIACEKEQLATEDTDDTEDTDGADTSSKPNIIIFMADDLDSGQLGCYGGNNVETPNIDLLATEGLQFDQMIASEAMCVPTRASLFTGLYPMRHGSFQNHKSVYDNVKSVGHYLSDLGYKVGLTGKGHSTKPESSFPFDKVEGFETKSVSKTDVYSLEKVREYITAKDKPYCLFIMSINPHAPFTVGDPSQFDPDDLELPEHWVDTEKTRNRYSKYLAEVKRLDNQVGNVREMLKQTGQDKNTIFIFLGEQGPQFPGGKWTLWDNGQKSSMIIKWSGKAEANSKTDAIVQYEDITPTLVDIAGGKPIDGLDGKSFLPVITGKSNVHRNFAYGIHNNIPEGPAYPIRAIRDKQYKLIMNLKSEENYYIKYMMNPDKQNSLWNSWIEKSQTSSRAKFLAQRIVERPPVEFYDLQQDPFELNNLAQDPAYEELVNSYSVELKKWMQEQGDEGATVDKWY